MQKLPLPVSCLLLLVALAFTAPASAYDFGPGPDPAVVEAERQRLLTEREEMGDNAFAIQVIAQLEFLIEALPPGHPRFADRAFQLGTPEHFYTTRPYFIQHAAAMLAELDDDRALSVLWDFVLLYDRTVIDMNKDRVRLGVGVHTDEYAVGAAWLAIAANDLGTYAAIAQLADLRTRSWAIMNYVNQRAGENPEEWEDNAFPYIDDENQDENMLIHLATSQGPPLRLAQNLILIDDMASKLMWKVDPEQMDAYLAHADLRVRVAAANIVYRQQATVPEQLIAAGHDVWLDEEEAQNARQTLAAIWQAVRAEREVLYEQAPAWEHGEHNGRYTSRLSHYQGKLAQNADLLSHLARITSFNQYDAVFYDLISDPENDHALWRKINQRQIDANTLTPAQIDMIVANLCDATASPSARTQLAKQLFYADIHPAADAIIDFFNETGTLHGLSQRPGELYWASPYDILSPEFMDWLREHGTAPADRVAPE